MTEAEQVELLADMQSILGYVEQVESVATTGASEVVGPLRNVMREDGEGHPSGAYTEALIREAPASEAGFVKVTQVFSGDSLS